VRIQFYCAHPPRTAKGHMQAAPVLAGQVRAFAGQWHGIQSVYLTELPRRFAEVLRADRAEAQSLIGFHFVGAPMQNERRSGLVGAPN